ncbi:hypothetical protein [Helicobacter sp. 23-1045]
MLWWQILRIALIVILSELCSRRISFLRFFASHECFAQNDKKVGADSAICLCFVIARQFERSENNEAIYNLFYGLPRSRHKCRLLAMTAKISQILRFFTQITQIRRI